MAHNHPSVHVIMFQSLVQENILHKEILIADIIYLLVLRQSLSSHVMPDNQRSQPSEIVMGFLNAKVLLAQRHPLNMLLVNVIKVTPFKILLTSTQLLNVNFCNLRGPPLKT